MNQLFHLSLEGINTLRNTIHKGVMECLHQLIFKKKHFIQD